MKKTDNNNQSTKPNSNNNLFYGEGSIIDYDRMLKTDNMALAIITAMTIQLGNRAK